VIVTVTAPEADELDATWQRVTHALASLPFDVVVKVGQGGSARAPLLVLRSGRGASWLMR
jgi:hypothetical protein